MPSVRRGFTLAELMVALVLGAVLATAAVRLLLGGSRLHRAQVERMRQSATLRVASALLPWELRELNPGAASGPDIVAVTASSITYRSLQGLHIVCRAATPGTSVVLVAAEAFAERALDPARDSLLIFAEGDPNNSLDDVWMPAGLAAVSSGATCPGGEAANQIAVAGLTASNMQAVLAGAPIRNFEVTELRLYTGSAGAHWVGLRSAGTDGSWSQTQPVFGPVTVGGLQLVLFDSLGAVTTLPAQAGRIGVAVSSDGSPPKLSPATARLQIAFRNR
jgi:prepilin-type N-terminal cleavage/methylation domain-containing protein